MSIEHVDSFDHYNNLTNFRRKYDVSSTTSGVTSGRFGGSAASCQNSFFALTLTAQQTRVVGFAFLFNNPTISAGTTLCQFTDSGTNQVDVRLTATGQLQVTRNGTQLGISSANVIVGFTWYYIEFKSKIDPTVGTYEVRVNGVTVVSGTGANTRNTANSSANGVTMGFFANTQGQFVDDLYILNTLGSVNNDFLGECRILLKAPTGDGASTQWAPSTGVNHWANVDDNPPNDDTDYNSDANVGDIDLYTYPAVAPTGLIAGVQTVMCVRKDDAGTRQLSEVCRSGGTNFVGSGVFTMLSTYLMFREIRETDPATGIAWTQSGVNNAQFGAKVIA
jgi:hypothetical protein